MSPLDQGSRYDDSVLNVLRLESDRTPASRVALYRNLIDLMMQGRASTRGPKRTRIFETLGRIHGDVPPQIRRQVSDTIARQRIAQPLDLISWLWRADPDSTLPMLETLQLREDDWLHLLPRLPQAALAKLAHRSDMTDQVRRALVSLGATGLGLPPAPTPTDQSPAQPIVATEMQHIGGQDAPTEELHQTVHLLPVDQDAEKKILEEPVADLPAPDWSQFNRRQSEQELKRTNERIDFIARAVLGGDLSALENISVAASNDDQPVVPADHLVTPALEAAEPALSESHGSADIAEHPASEPPEKLSEEAQRQIRDLIGRIADFRRRWIDKKTDTVSRPLEQKPDQAATLAAVADAIQADVRSMAGQDADQSPPPHTHDADIVPEADDNAPLVLTPSIAANIGPATSPLATPAQREARIFSDIAASLADFQWDSDRAGRFVLAKSPLVPVEHGAGLLPDMVGRTLLSLFDDLTTRAMVDRAMQRRIAFRDARFSMDKGSMKGLWRLSGVPVFDARSGQFQGFRGSAEKLGTAALALLESSQNADPAPTRSTPMSSDRFDTLAHETRTPLNAIMGFAQLIDGQAWGEVPDQYRARASAILEESNRLLRALDDVSDQAKLDRGAYSTHVSNFDPAAVLVSLQETFAADAERRDVHLLTRISDGLPHIWSDRDAIERALGRLLVVALAGAKSQDLIVLGARVLPNDDVCFTISQPAKSSSIPADDAEKIAEGFGIRLVRQLAGALSGRLDLSDRRLELIIPAMVQLPEPSRGRL